jgi:hypothetical protein
MEIKSLDNFYTIILILVVFAIAYVGYIYYTKQENFESPIPKGLIAEPEPIKVPRKVSPSGPNPPNARIPNASMNQEESRGISANDPQDEKYGSQNIQDNLRYPERSFGPGTKNNGTQVLVDSGASSTKILPTAESIQPFNSETISSGGLMGSIGANDTNLNQNYSSF